MFYARGMEYEKAKKTIKEMAEEIDKGNFTQEKLTEFVLAFRFELFQKEVLEQGPFHPSYARKGFVSCSCGDVEKSCHECGPGFTTGFAVNDNGKMTRFKIKK
jgi:hypothetical protein